MILHWLKISKERKLDSLSTKLKFHQKYVAAKRIFFQKKKKIIKRHEQFQLSISKKIKKKKTLYLVSRATRPIQIHLPISQTSYSSLLSSPSPPSRYFTFLTLKPRLNINPLYIPIDGGRKTSVASIVPPLLRVSNFLYPANVIAG